MILICCRACEEFWIHPAQWFLFGCWAAVDLRVAIIVTEELWCGLAGVLKMGRRTMANRRNSESRRATWLFLMMTISQALALNTFYTVEYPAYSFPSQEVTLVFTIEVICAASALLQMRVLLRGLLLPCCVHLAILADWVRCGRNILM